MVGGAIAAYGGRTVVRNSTFEGNTADVGGALEVFTAEVTFTHVTMMDNVAFIHGNAIHRTGGVIKLRNSIDGGVGRAANCTNGLTEARGNISQDGTCALLETRTEPLLGELTGSPAWIPLLDGSPALDAADPEFCLETDQIGTARPQGGGCDIGAIESTTAPACANANLAAAGLYFGPSDHGCQYGCAGGSMPGRPWARYNYAASGHHTPQHAATHYKPDHNPGQWTYD